MNLVYDFAQLLFHDFCAIQDVIRPIFVNENRKMSNNSLKRDSNKSRQFKELYCTYEVTNHQRYIIFLL